MRAPPSPLRWTSTLVLAVAALSAACSDASESTPTPATPATATASAAPTTSPTPLPMLPHAPDGRSGIPQLDALIELLLRGQADELASRFPVGGRQSCLPSSPPGTPQLNAMPPVEWTSRFASASRSLYAVFRGQPNEAPASDYQIVFAVSAADAPTGWRFYVDDDRIVDIVAGCEGPPSGYVPSVAYMYERFVILPPREDLPQPPAGHPMSMRSGNREVDALLDMLHRRDLTAVNALISTHELPCSGSSVPPSPSPRLTPPAPSAAPPLVPCPPGVAPGTPVSGLLESGCPGHRVRLANPPPLQWAVREGVTLHGIAAFPDGHQPDADHVVMLISPEAAFRWGAGAILMKGERIVAALDRCGVPEVMYPPSRYLIAPPPLGQLAPEGRNLGVASLDRIIAAMRGQDAAALLAATDFEQVACAAEATGIGGPPLCRAGEPAGTVVDAITSAQCEGAMVRRDELTAAYSRLMQQRREVFAVTDRGERESEYSFGRGRYELVFEGRPESSVTPEQRATSNMSFIANERGVTLVRFGCGPGPASDLISPGRAPAWLIAPPGWQPPS